MHETINIIILNILSLIILIKHFKQVLSNLLWSVSDTFTLFHSFRFERCDCSSNRHHVANLHSTNLSLNIEQASIHMYKQHNLHSTILDLNAMRNRSSCSWHWFTFHYFRFELVGQSTFIAIEGNLHSTLLDLNQTWKNPVRINAAIYIPLF